MYSKDTVLILYWFWVDGRAWLWSNYDSLVITTSSACLWVSLSSSRVFVTPALIIVTLAVSFQTEYLSSWHAVVWWTVRLPSRSRWHNKSWRILIPSCDVWEQLLKAQLGRYCLIWDLSSQPPYIYSVVWFCFSLFTQSRLVSTRQLLSVDSVIRTWHLQSACRSHLSMCFPFICASAGLSVWVVVRCCLTPCKVMEISPETFSMLALKAGHY